MSTFPDTLYQKESDHNRAGGNPLVSGTQAFVFHDDFFATPVAADWTTTEIKVGAAGSVASTATVGGQLLITTAANDDDGTQLQAVFANFLPAAGKDIWFETRMKLVTAAKHVQSDLLVGLAADDTTVLAAPQNGIYFTKADGSALVGAVTNKATTKTTSAGVFTLAPDTWYRLGFFVDGVSGCSFYVNGELVATQDSTTIPIVELTPTFAVLNGEAGATAWRVDYIRCTQIR